MTSTVNSEDINVIQKITIDALEDLDFNVIEDMPWAQNLWRQVADHTRRGFLNWCKVVKNVAGTKEEHIQEWSKLYIQSVDEIVCDMFLDLVQTQSSTIDKIEELWKRLRRACLELHQPVPKKIGEKNLSLYEEQKQLMKHIQEYEGVVDAKKQELEILNEKQRRVCTHLGQEPTVTLQYPPLPTPDQLEQFAKHVEKLEAEMFEREEQYYILKDEIIEYVTQLKYKPNCDFEREVLSLDHMLVTKENMEKLQFFSTCLKDIKKSTEEQISQYRSRIEDLWKMLEQDLIYMDKFRTQHTGNSLETLEALRDEVKRCEELRKANVKIFVEKQRLELETLWKQCQKCSEMEKINFKYYYNECYTDDLFDIHELEIQKWRQYYEENSRLLKLLEKHQELWKKVMELEERSTDTNRYKNRGGKLLQEEKERNSLFKQIPKLEEEILALSDEFRNKNYASFVTFDKTPEEYLEQMHAQRENNRKLKLSARKMQRDNTMARTPGKSAVSLFPSTSVAVTPTGLSATKRKILTTPNTENLKRLRVATPRNASVKPKTTPRTVPTIKVTYAPATLPSQKRKSRSSLNKTIRKVRSRGHVPAASEEDVTMNTYSDFQNELSSREACRSTLLPDGSVQETPTRSTVLKKRAPEGPLFKTPSKTPMSLGANRLTEKSKKKKT